MTIQAVIFDMDGVLVDSEGYWEECRVDFAQELGKSWAAEDQRLVMGRGSAEWGQIMARLAQAPDHPIALTFPEGSYLKGLLCRVW